MTHDLAVPTWLVVVTLLVLAGLVLGLLRLERAVRAARSQTEAVLAAATRDADALREQLIGLEEELRADPDLPLPGAVVRADDREYVITELAQTSGPRVPARVVPAPLFADIVLRESVIKTAALAAGLRRALSPEVRNRIRFEMRREVKRSRKQRRLMLRAARRDWETRHPPGAEVAS